MTTILFHHPAFIEHDTGPGHPERADRMRAVAKALEHEAFATLVRAEAPLADEAKLRLGHPAAYIAALEAARPPAGGHSVRIDSDTVLSPGSWEAAVRAVGAGIAAVDAVMTGTAHNAFCAVRPPGHHAEAHRAMGFCLFNSIAISAKHARVAHGAERVAVIDFDVHHGNGTQDIFWSDKDLFYGSTHQMPLYPGTGALSETGAGNIWNAPLRDGDAGDTFRDAFETHLTETRREVSRLERVIEDLWEKVRNHRADVPPYAEETTVPIPVGSGASFGPTGMPHTREDYDADGDDTLVAWARAIGDEPTADLPAAGSDEIGAKPSTR